jgi:polyisoprenoid-binding protein YceI
MLRRLLVLIALIGALPAHATQWAVQHEASRLGFVASWEGKPFEGTFTRWSADMRFDADQLVQSRFHVTIDMASADTRSAERDQELLKPDWFFVKRFPKATFVTSQIRWIGDDHYEAVGTLTIKDHSQPVVLPFTWTQNGKRATMQGEVTIDRLRWKVGEGEWTDDSVIQREVRVVVDLELTACRDSEPPCGPLVPE